MWLINRDIAFLMMIADGRHFASSALAAPASVLTPESLGISNPMSSLRLSPDQEAQLQNFRDASLAAAAEAPPIPLVEVGALTPQEIEVLGTNGVADLAVPPPEMTVLDLAVPSAGLVPEAPLALEPMQTPAPGSFDLAPMRLREARGGSGAGVDDRPFTTYEAPAERNEAPAERNEAPAETNESPPDPPSSYSGPSE